MSLRSYLFSLIGALIILLTITQLSLLYWLEKNMAEAVDFRARHISEQVIELAIDKIGDNQTDTIIKHKVMSQDTPHLDKKTSSVTVSTLHKQKSGKAKKHFEIIDSESNNEVYEFIVDENSTQPIAQLTNEALSKHLKKIVHSIHNKDIEIITTPESSTLALKEHKVLTNNGVSKIWVEKFEHNNTPTLISYFQIIIILSAIVALIFAYWLSIQFNKPLKRLSTGFEHLAKGDYQHQVPSQGVNEIRVTIEHFNKVVATLKKLTSEAAQHKEMSHLAELGEVSRGLAHALRNPIHTIGLSIEQLEDGNLTSNQQNKLLSTVKEKIEHIDKNIKALLTLTTSGISRDEQVPILAVVQDIVLEYKSCATKSQTFEINIEPSLQIHGAESEVRTILHTLIVNACDANLTSKVIKIIALSTECFEPTANNAKINNEVIIQVIDLGNGLDQNIVDDLFKPHISTKPEGAGMGLYISKRLISLHYDGDITVTNNKDLSSGCTASAIFYKESETKGNEDE